MIRTWTRVTGIEYQGGTNEKGKSFQIEKNTYHLTFVRYYRKLKLRINKQIVGNIV